MKSVHNMSTHASIIVTTKQHYFKLNLIALQNVISLKIPQNKNINRHKSNFVFNDIKIAHTNIK